MKLLKIIGVAVIALLVLVIGLAALQPATFSVTRTAVIAAPSAQVFALVNDFHEWEKWSPWAKLDPDAKSVYEGTAQGEGAVFAWDGDRNVGAGRMTITESRAYDLIRIRLDFSRPFEGTSETEFAFKLQENGTLVSWTMTGRNDFPARVVSLFFDCEKMIGGLFDQGLANMKALAES